MWGRFNIAHREYIVKFKGTNDKFHIEKETPTYCKNCLFGTAEKCVLDLVPVLLLFSTS